MSLTKLEGNSEMGCLLYELDLLPLQLPDTEPVKH